jgi:hypothetical protein
MSYDWFALLLLASTVGFGLVLIAQNGISNEKID